MLWVWSVNRVDNLPDKTIARVYPGDEWVDWVGASGYLRNVPDGVTPTFEYTFGQTLDAIEAVAPTKLVMLTEVGAGTTESNRVSWLSSFFQGLLDRPEIIVYDKAFHGRSIATLSATGTSTPAYLPAFIAATAIGVCSSQGVAITTASMDLSASSSL